jgi:Peptidase family S41
MKIFFYLLLVLPVISIKAQTNNTYLADITSLRNILQKTPSYRDQIKGQTVTIYNELFEKLKSDSSHNTSDYKYFYNLAQLFFPIQDNHLAFYQIDKFPKESAFSKFDGNIDSLKSVIETKALDSIEGIYFYGESYSVGIFKSNSQEYTGVVLNSNTPIWKKGQIAVHLYETSPGYFKAIYAHPKYKYLILYQIEKYSHHSLVNSYFYSSLSESIYSKVAHEPDYVNLPKNIYDFHFKSIDVDIQYLHIKHFSADTDDIKKSEAFYDSIKNYLTASNLILDLRNNNGGAEKVSKKFLGLLKNFVKNGKLYVLVNNGTMSQGEIFTLQLKQSNNVKILGQTTRGMLVYGSNYGKREKLPSQAFEIYITDMKGDKRLVPYENYGIHPDVILSDDKDWIGQTIEIIRKK